MLIHVLIDSLLTANSKRATGDVEDPRRKSCGHAREMIRSGMMTKKRKKFGRGTTRARTTEDDTEKKLEAKNLCVIVGEPRCVRIIARFLLVFSGFSFFRGLF